MVARPLFYQRTAPFPPKRQDLTVFLMLYANKSHKRNGVSTEIKALCFKKTPKYPIMHFSEKILCLVHVSAAGPCLQSKRLPQDTCCLPRVSLLRQAEGADNGGLCGGLVEGITSDSYHGCDCKKSVSVDTRTEGIARITGLPAIFCAKEADKKMCT